MCGRGVLLVAGYSIVVFLAKMQGAQAAEYTLARVLVVNAGRLILQILHILGVPSQLKDAAAARQRCRYGYSQGFTRRKAVGDRVIIYQYY